MQAAECFLITFVRSRNHSISWSVPCRDSRVSPWWLSKLLCRELPLQVEFKAFFFAASLACNSRVLAEGPQWHNIPLARIFGLPVHGLQTAIFRQRRQMLALRHFERCQQLALMDCCRGWSWSLAGNGRRVDLFSMGGGWCTTVFWSEPQRGCGE